MSRLSYHWYDLSRFGHRGRDPRRGARSRIESRCLSLLHFAMARLEHKRDRGLINRPLRPLLSSTAIKASFTPGGREPRIADLTALILGMSTEGGPEGQFF